MVLYGRALGFPFFYDDFFLVRPIETWRFGAISPMRNYWRPLWTLWMSVQYQLFGLNPGPMHALSLALHVVNCWLVLSLLAAARVEKRVAIATAALWTLMGGNATAIVWISDCSNLIALMLVLLATRLWISVPGGKGLSLTRSALASALWMVAMLCKEVAFVWPVVAVAYTLRSSRRMPEGRAATRAGLAALLPPLLALGGYFALRFAFMGRTAGFSIPQVGRTSLRALPLAAIVVARGVHYAEALLYNILPLDLFQTWFGLVAGVVITLALIGALIAAARGLPPSHLGSLAWGLAWVALFSLHGSFNPLPRNLYFATLGTSFVLCTVSLTSQRFVRSLLPVLLLFAYVTMHACLGQQTADYLSAGSLSSRIHSAQLLVGNDPLMAPGTITPEKRELLRAQLRFDDVRALSRQKEEETIWRSLLQRAFRRVFGGRSRSA